MVPTPPVIKTPIILPIISRISLTNFDLSFYFHFNKKDFGLYNRSLCLNELCSQIYTFSNWQKIYLRKFMIKVTIISFSSGRDSATISVIATKALLDMTCFPSLYKALFLFRNSRKIEAPILLHPSAKGWSLIRKYRRLAAFSSIEG